MSNCRNRNIYLHMTNVVTKTKAARSVKCRSETQNEKRNASAQPLAFHWLTFDNDQLALVQLWHPCQKNNRMTTHV